MESTSSGGVDGVPTPGTDVLRAAAELRFGRPDLTAVLGRHLMEVAVAGTDRDGWLAAAAWWVHAVAAVGDGRDAASEVLEQLPHWGDDALSVTAADRLRIELAVVAHDAGEDSAARALLATPVTGRGPELAADVAVATVRCLGADVGGDPDATLDAAVSAWARVDGPRGEVGAASATLVAAAVARRRGRAEHAVGLAVDGLARLDRGRGRGMLTPSGHLAAALAAEWISALIDAGRAEQAREGSVPLRARLLDQTRPTRQLALLRLTIARASASDPWAADADPADELGRAAQDAAAADVPDLEHICRTAMGELYESQGRLDAALESIRLAVVADRRSRARAARLRAALTAASTLWASPPATLPDGNDGAGPNAGPRTTNGNGNGSADRTAILRVVRSAQRSATLPLPADHPAGAVVEPSSARPAPVVPTEDPRPSPRPVRTADPWATGSWTGARAAAPEGGAVRATSSLLRPPVERLGPSGRPGDDAPARPTGTVPPVGTVSGATLFAPAPAVGPAEPEPDTWLATALAELDRIWGTPDTAPAPPTAEADGCVVVLDLARAGVRLPPGAVTPTLQRVARRLADRLPPRSRLRDDSPDALSIVLPGRDRAAASEWMHRVLPGLVDGLAVDEAVAGALLRAAVHDAEGVVGAQVLQRLEGGHRADVDRRAERDAAASRWEPPRHAVPESDRVAADAADGPPAGYPGGAAPGNGRAPDRGPVERGPVGRETVERGPVGRETVERGPVGRETVERGPVGRETVERGPVGRSAVGSSPEPAPSGAPARHDESAGRPPYLPDGVVVRPGSGGRRHRRGPVDAAAEPADAPGPAPRSPAPQSTEGLGLADLLAGALAAYRGI